MSDFAAVLWSRCAVLFGAFSVGATSSAAHASTGVDGHDKAQLERTRNPVLLIHGVRDSAVSMQPMKCWLERRGWKVHTLSLVPGDGRVRLELLAGQIKRYVEDTFPAGRRIDLVGFSMGGVVSRYYLQRLGGTERVQRFVCIAAPNHGSWMAYLSSAPGCVQMRPGSEFLHSLNNDISALGKVNMTCLWTPLDLMILPASSSRMPAGTEVREWVVAHPLMVLQPVVLRRVEEALLNDQ